MKLLINAIPLLTPLTGIGKYTYEISKILQYDFDTTFYYGFYSKRIIKKDFDLKKRNLFLKKVIKKFLFSLSSIRQFDIYWEPNFVINPKIKAKKRVVTIHDYSFMNENWHPKERVNFFRENFWKNIYLADEIIVVSNFIKEETIKYLEFDETKIHVIYNGINENIFKPYSEEELFSIKRKYNLPNKFILFVGSIEPRKNLLTLLKVYNNLPEKLKNNYPLILIGFKGWNNKEIIQLLEKNKNYIKYVGYVSEEELAKIYNLATLFVYPSLYEGFGIPVLEAMACGVPVLTSNVSAIPEVGGDCVFYCNPFDEEDLLNKLLYLLNNEEIRNKKIYKAFKRVKNFTWAESALKHKKLFERLRCELG